MTMVTWNCGGPASCASGALEFVFNRELQVKPFIVIGDKTSHGGTVVTSAATTSTMGKQVARVGDRVPCPVPGHGNEVIVSGDPTVVVEGKPCARHGDKTSCGATLISSQTLSGAA